VFANTKRTGNQAEAMPDASIDFEKILWPGDNNA
jgi:hypothetical protein